MNEEEDLREIRDLVIDAMGPLSGGDGRHPDEFEIATYLEGKLASREEEEFEHHVAFCASCATELMLASRVLKGAKEAEEVDVAPAAAAEAAPATSEPIPLRPRTTPAVESDPGWWRMAAGFALFLTGVGGALMAGQTVTEGIETQLVAQVESAFDGKIKVGDADIDLAEGAVRLAAVAVADPAGGETPLLQAEAARLEVDLGALAGGNVSGSLHLDGPMIHVVRDRSGGVNIDGLFDGRRKGDLFKLAGQAAFDNVFVRDGQVRVVDNQGATPTAIQLADLDADIRDLRAGGGARIEALAGLESAVQNVRVAGSVGPWQDGAPTSYRLDEVRAQGVPMSAWPQLASHVRGGVSFDGRLEARGSRWAELASTVAGSGQLRVSDGALRARNLVREVMGPLLEGGQDPTVQLRALTGTDTDFAELAAPVQIAAGGVRTGALALRGEGYRVDGSGELSGDGSVDFRGEFIIDSAVSARLAAIIPGSGDLRNERGELAVPFTLTGTWPAVEARVDVQVAVRRVLEERGLAWLSFLPGLPWLG